MPNYDFQYLKNIYLSDKKFIRLMKEWKKHSYDREFTPTLDRINRNKTYSINNINLLSYAENRYKFRMEVKPIHWKPVKQKLKGKVVAYFKSLTEASQETGVRLSGISQVLNEPEHYHTAGGYVWEYN